MRCIRWTRLTTALLLAVAIVACKDGSEPEPDPVVTGAWSGASQGLTLNLTLNQATDGSVSGSGNISGSTANLSLAVRQGTHVYPNVSLILGAAGYEDINFAGKLVNETQIAGTMNGSGFNGFAVNLTRR